MRSGAIPPGPSLRNVIVVLSAHIVNDMLPRVGLICLRPKNPDPELNAGDVASASAEGRERALVTLGTWASFVRDAACYAAGAPELALWSSYRAALERWAQDLSAARIVAILHRLVAASEAVAAYAQPRLAFEALMLDVFGGADSPPPVDPLPRDVPRAARGPARVSAGATGSTGRRPRAAPRGRSRAAG